MRRRLLEFAGGFPAAAVTGALLAFAASLTPSLIPRTFLVQGALSGIAAATGYGAGLLLLKLWRYLQVPEIRGGAARWARTGALLPGAAMAALGLYMAPVWQDSVRELMKMEPVNVGYRVEILLLALAVFAVILLLARLFRLSFQFFTRRISAVAPPRLAIVLGGLLAVLLFWSIAQGVIFSMALRVLDSSFRELDALVEDGVVAPTDPMKTGSPQSLLRWDGLGRQGHRFITSGPSRADIEALSGGSALEPIRVYAGLSSADTAEERARLALEELKRTGGFERSLLVIIVPTGTGMVDPAAIDPLEYLHNGDVASVAVQYSYLASWLSLLVEPDYGSETGRALFRKVYDHWTSLPRDRRPRLYLHGLSLGAMSSEASTDFHDVIADPFQGALWSGPPFAAKGWRSITDARQPGSPQWLPRFRDGSVVRFTNQQNALGPDGAKWGPVRIVYLQYASDPITFFEKSMFHSRPDWMNDPRGPDVSPELAWYPVITFLQLVVDMAIGTTTPAGYGHVFAPEHYVDAWVEVTVPPGATEEFIERLKAHFRGLREKTANSE